MYRNDVLQEDGTFRRRTILATSRACKRAIEACDWGDSFSRIWTGLNDDSRCPVEVGFGRRPL